MKKAAEGEKIVRKMRIVKVVIVLLFIVASCYFIDMPQKAAKPKPLYTDNITEKETVIGNTVRLDYVDENGKITYINKLHYATLIKTFDEKERIVKEEYFDEAGLPAEQSGGYCSKEIEYIGEEDNITTYYDEAGNKYTNYQGYCSLKTEGNKETGITHTFLNEEGNPVMLTLGYAIRTRTYKNSSCYEMYYDENNNQVELGHGQYGVKYTGDKVAYLDKNGKVFYPLNMILNAFPFLIIIAGVIISFFMIVLPKKLSMLLFAAYMLFMIYMTLLFRGGQVRFDISPFWSYRKFFEDKELRAQIIKNIWLFVPVGAYLRNFGKKKWLWIFTLGVSLGIETIQEVLNIGQWDIDDVFNNVLGGLLGWYLGEIVTECLYCKKISAIMEKYFEKLVTGLKKKLGSSKKA